MADAQQMLEELKNFDTPSITNVVATYSQHPECLGLYNPWSENWYTDHSVRCMYPELGRRVGYAVTAVYGLPDPNFDRLSFPDVIDAMEQSPQPTIFSPKSSILRSIWRSIRLMLLDSSPLVIL